MDDDGNDGQVNLDVEGRLRNKSNPNFEGSENQRYSFTEQRKLDFHQKYEIKMYEHKRKEEAERFN